MALRAWIGLYGAGVEGWMSMDSPDRWSFVQTKVISLHGICRYFEFQIHLSPTPMELHSASFELPISFSHPAVYALPHPSDLRTYQAFFRETENRSLMWFHYYKVFIARYLITRTAICLLVQAARILV